MSRERQRIEMVAGIIAENGLAPEAARRINAGTGWTYDVRWADQDYISESDYTRVEGDRLSSDDLERALSLARAWGIRRLLLTVKEAAGALRVTPETVRDWIRAGELPAVDLGGRTGYRIDAADLDDFIARRKARK